jgi:ATP-dependent RNA circularization protein (DNA/RNA ligase family)
MVPINEKDKSWLLNHFAEESYGKIMRGTTVYDYLYAEKILKGYNKIKRRSCGCEYGGVQRSVNKLYEEWLDKETT